MQANPSSPSSGSPAGNAKLIWWIKRIGIVIAILIVLAVLFAPSIVRGVIRHELQATISGSLNAQLEIDDLSWHPLLGVSIGHASLVGTGPDGKPATLVEWSGMNTSLASIPFGGPMVVENFVLDDPSIQLIRLPSGEVELDQNLLKPQPASTKPWGKTSDTIQVKHFQIKNLTVQVIDEQNPSAKPEVWMTMDAEGSQNGSGPGAYDVQVALNEGPAAKMNLNCSVDTDGLGLKLKNFSLTATAPTDDQLSQLPAPLADYIRGKALQGAGLSVTVADNAALAVDLAKNHWTVTGLDGQMQLTSPQGKPLADGKVTFSIHGGGPLPSEQMTGMSFLGSLDPDSAMSVKTDSKLSIESTVLAQPVSDGAFDLEYANGTLTLKSFDVNYGSKPVHLDMAANLLAQQAKLAGFHLNVAQGTVLVDSAEMDLTPPYHYSASLSYSGIQLSDAKVIAQIPDAGGKLAGIAEGKLNVSGTLPPGVSPLTVIQGDGKVHVEQGDFWDIPFLGQIAGKINPNFSQAGRVGEAGVVYTLGGGEMHISKMAVSSPLVGVQGSGDVALTGDNELNLNVVAAPLGDWKKQIDKTGVPGIALFGKVVGSAQQAMNKVSQQVLLSFQVTGPAMNPTITPKAAPAVTGAIGDLFSAMAKPSGGGGSGSSGGLLNFMDSK
jgi:hypothetical protein